MKWSIPILLLVFVIYLLFFPTGLRPELGFRPVWTVDVAAAQVTDKPQPQVAAPVPFDLGGLFGYVNIKGDLLLKEEKLFGLAIDRTRYVSFPNVPENLVLHDNAGRVTETLEAVGYPILLDGRLLIISTSRSAIAEMTGGEAPSWKREYTTVITDIDARAGLIALGLLDSRIQVLERSGEAVLDLELKGSRINAVYGCALSDDTSKLAVIHGIDPQYVSIIDMMSEAVEITNYRLESEYRTTRFLRFFDSDRYLVIEENTELKILDLEKNSDHRVSIQGSFVNAGVFAGDNLIWVLSEADGASGFSVIDPPERVIFNNVLAAGAKTFPAGDYLILGIDGNLCMVQKEQR